jgi:hypothetical protein
MPTPTTRPDTVGGLTAGPRMIGERDVVPD